MNGSILAGRVQPVEESPVEPIIEEIFLGGRCCVEEGAQVIGVALKAEPALTLDEIEEHQAVEESLYVQAARFSLRHAFDARFHLLEHGAIFREEPPGNGFNVERAGPFLEPGCGVVPAVLGPFQRRQVELAERAEMAVALLPAEGRQPGRLGLVALKVGDGAAFVVAGDAEKQQVRVIPRRQVMLPPSARHQAAQHPPQHGAVDLLLRELNNEDAPRLPMHEVDLPDLAGEEVFVEVLGAQVVGRPAVTQVLRVFDLLGDRPFQGIGKQDLNEAAPVRDAVDGLLDLLGGRHRVNSMQAFYAKATHTSLTRQRRRTKPFAGHTSLTRQRRRINFLRWRVRLV